jgi:hypothetical protein
MLILADMLPDTIAEDRMDIPMNTIHTHSDLNADLYLMWDGVAFSCISPVGNRGVFTG